MSCSICLMDLKDPQVTICNHIFCKECLQGWLKIKSNCPYCRTPTIGKICLNNFKHNIAGFKTEDPIYAQLYINGQYITTFNKARQMNNFPIYIKLLFYNEKVILDVHNQSSEIKVIYLPDEHISLPLKVYFKEKIVYNCSERLLQELNPNNEGFFDNEFTYCSGGSFKKINTY